MTSRRFTVAFLSAAALCAPTMASAHTGVGDVQGFVHGFTHPLGGIDHLLAMVMVGVLAVQLGGRALWAVPCAFVTLMAVGGAMGLAGVDLPFVEVAIATSVLVLGLAIALQLQAPVSAVVALVGGFAVFHGFAHGAEMPDSVGAISYGAGFILATALLHCAGLGLGSAIGRLAKSRSSVVLRTMGAGAALAGIGLLAGAF